MCQPKKNLKKHDHQLFIESVVLNHDYTKTVSRLLEIDPNYLFKTKSPNTTKFKLAGTLENFI